MAAVVVLFMRSPSDPRIKARLEPSVPSPDSRRELALAFLDDVAAGCRTLPDVALRIAVTVPTEGLRLARPTLPVDVLMAQRAGSMGERMRGVLEEVVRAGFTRVILLGSDLPDLPAAVIADALATLAADPAGVVIGPSGPGTYYLLGVNARADAAPDLFTGVRWDEANALADTEAAAATAGLAVHHAPQWRDVDTPEDLDALGERLRQTPAAAPATAAVMQRLGML